MEVNRGKMKAVILAGGYGTRLRPLTLTRPKPMIPLLNKPVIGHVVEYLASYGVTEIVVTTTFLREMIMEQLEGRAEVQLSFPTEPVPLGTAGSVKNAGLDAESEPFVVIQGDNITDLNLHDLIEYHHDAGGLVTIALQEVKDPWHYGVALLDGRGCITRFHEKPPKNRCFSNLASTGIYVVDPKAMAYVPEGIPFDFARDLFQLLHQKEQGRLFGYPLKPGQFWADVGQPEGYLQATEWMLSRGHRDILMGDNVELDAAGLTGPVVIGDGALIEEGCTIGPRTVLFEGVNIGRNSCLQQSLVGEGAMIGTAASIREATIGPHCMLGNEVNVHNSMVWPFVVIPHHATVDTTIKRFVRFTTHRGARGGGTRRSDLTRLFRTVSEEEAFYFNLVRDGKVVHTGYVARTIQELLEILKKVDQRSIEYHLGRIVRPTEYTPFVLYNDFASWIRNVLGEEHLANAVAALDPGNPREELVSMIQEWMRARELQVGGGGA
jgi:mannose-1-phosphate guanylyltransferase/phosphomannomutase